MRLIRSLTPVLLLLLSAPPGAAQEPFDLVIQGGRVLDGTGTPWRSADIGVRGDRIEAVGDLSGASARRTIDATGLYVAPGFIDVHSHAGPGLATPELSAGEPILAQGITTVFVNPDGGGPVDLVEQTRELEADGLGLNVALLVPHGSLRREVVGVEDREPTPAELERMRALTRAGMEAGAFGLSSGLFYTPGGFAETEEVVELARVASDYGGVYTSHVRDEADYSVGVVAAVEEVIEVAREADLPGVVTHIKALGPRVWGFSNALVKRIETARAEGVEVWADQYPYEASATGLGSALIPRWAQDGGRDSLLQRLNDPETWPRIRNDMAENLDRRGGADRIQFRRYEPDPSIEGRTLDEVAEERGLHPLDAARDLVLEGEAGIVSFNMDPEDVELLMRQPWVMTSTDGDLVPMGEGVPHPRSYGAFPRKLEDYVVERGVLDLAAAIRSMTSTPAAVFGLDDRGLIRPGAVADLVVFDLDRVADPATFTDPHQLSEGMVHVLIGGEAAISDGSFTDARRGQVLRKETLTGSGTTGSR